METGSRCCGTLIVGLLSVSLPSVATAEEGSAQPAELKKREGSGSPTRRFKAESAAARFKPRDCELFCYVHWIGGLAVGRGLRFNNPFRLATPLGKDAESVSLSATYAELSVAVALGDPNGFQQGVSLNASVALQGVAQEVIALGYMAFYRASPRWSLRGRISAPVVLEPDVNIGGEVALGIGYLIWSGIGLYADWIASIYQGAATDQTAASWVPLASAQFGIVLDYEVLP